MSVSLQTVFSPLIRKRAILTFKALAAQELDVLKPICDDIIKRMKDFDDSVVGIALRLTSALLNVRHTCSVFLSFATHSLKLNPTAHAQIRSVINDHLHVTWSNQRGFDHRTLLSAVLQSIPDVGYELMLCPSWVSQYFQNNRRKQAYSLGNLPIKA